MIQQRGFWPFKTSSASLARVRALMAKEAAELRATKTVLVAPVLMLLTAVAMPFAVIVGVPALSGESLDGAGDVVAMARELAPGTLAHLAPEAAVQAFLLHQFLPLLVLVPVIGAMTLVTTSIVGERQARSLEPLLATPLTTAELLGAKTAVAFLVALALLAAGFGALVGGAVTLAKPGVAGTLLGARPLALVTALAPALACAALVLGVIASSRAKDARTAQQFGVVVVLPVVGLFVAQLGGRWLLDVGAILAGAAALWLAVAVLAWIGVRVFDREHILTRWT